MPGSTIRSETIHSHALEGNPLGDPAVRQLLVYLPPGYAESSQSYPVVLLLAGFTNRGERFLHRKGWDESIQERMDRLIHAGRSRPMILVMPDGFTRYGGGQYLNSSAVGHYQDYLLETLEYVEARFHTHADRAYRGVAGTSSGGFGALRLAMACPDTFSMVADHSGDKYFEYCYRPEFPRFLRAVERVGDLASVLRDPAAMRPKGAEFHALMNVAAMSACYSPNPDSPLGFDLPVDLETGELIPETWARWLAHDPVHLVEDHTEALRSLRLLYFDCGRRDQFNLNFGCRILSRRLSALGIEHQYDEFDDDHFSIDYRYDISLQAISRALPDGKVG